MTRTGALLAAALLAGCLAPASTLETASAPAPAPPLDAEGFVDLGFEGVEHLQATIPSPVGGTIHAEYWLPEGAGPDRPVPVIVEVSPYHAPSRHMGGSPLGPDRHPWIAEFVPRGTALAFVDARGFGGSSGCWDYYGDDEMADAVAAVEWFASQPWSTGRVAMMGTSYPGTTQLLAAIGPAEGLVAIVPVAPEASVYENQFKNGVQYANSRVTSSAIYATIYPALGLAPPGTSPSGYPGWAASLADPTCLAESTPALLDPDARYGPYYAERDRQDDAHRVEAAVFWSHGFWDQNVKPDTFTPFWETIEAPKRAWFWHGYHQSPFEEASGREDFARQRHLWLDRWLHGAANGIDARPPVEVQDSLGRWRFENAWPPADAAPFALHPTAEGALEASPPSGGSASFATHPRTSFGAIVAGGGRTGDPFVPAGAHFTSATAPLEEDLHVAGVPQYHLRMSSDRTRGQVVVGLFDVAPDGTWTLVDRGALDLRHREGVDRVVDVVPGEVMDLAFDGWPTDWVFPAGHRVATVVVGTEARYVTPDATHTVEIGLGEGTRVELPRIAPRTEFFDRTESTALAFRERMPAPEGFDG